VQEKNTPLVTMTKRGHAASPKDRPVARRAGNLHGLMKHEEGDTMQRCYRLYQKRGGAVSKRRWPSRSRCWLCIKSATERELVRRPKNEGVRKSVSAIAERHGLQVIDGKIPLPTCGSNTRNADLKAAQ